LKMPFPVTDAFIKKITNFSDAYSSMLTVKFNCETYNKATT